MGESAERILLVENDPDIGAFITRQVLQPPGYQARRSTPLIYYLLVKLDCCLLNSRKL
jgi:hypothetical protein